LRRFIFTFDGDKVTAEGVGIEGKTCVSETEKLLEVFKPKLLDRKLKPEYNKQKVGQLT
jgi:hypothetical protein